jgi:hypothetical protein
VGSIRFNGVRFVAYPEDHEPRHVHGFYAETEVIVEFRNRPHKIKRWRARIEPTLCAPAMPAAAMRGTFWKWPRRILTNSFSFGRMLMSEIARVVTTDAEIDAAIQAARMFEKYDRQVACATYSSSTDSLLLRMEYGVTYSIPRRLLQGLRDAPTGDLGNIELLGRGTGLYWPALDVAHSVSGLLAGVFGSENWMNQLQLEVGRSRLYA